MENIQELNYEYDYINCEDVLYFTADPVKSLQALKSVLKPEVISIVIIKDSIIILLKIYFVV